MTATNWSEWVADASAIGDLIIIGPLYQRCDCGLDRGPACTIVCRALVLIYFPRDNRSCDDCHVYDYHASSMHHQYGSIQVAHYAW